MGKSYWEGKEHPKWKMCCHTCQYHTSTLTDESRKNLEKYHERRLKAIEKIEKYYSTPPEERIGELNYKDELGEEPKAEWIGYCRIWDKYIKDYHTHFCKRYTLGDHVWNW